MPNDPSSHVNRYTSASFNRFCYSKTDRLDKNRHRKVDIPPCTYYVNITVTTPGPVWLKTDAKPRLDRLRRFPVKTEFVGIICESFDPMITFITDPP